MPTYVYSNSDRTVVEEFDFPMGKAPQMVVTNKEHVSLYRDYKLETKGGQQPSTWPMTSDNLGVHPDQIHETREFLARKGVPTDFNSEGQAILTSRKHRREVARARGFYDRNAGYGDPTPK